MNVNGSRYHMLLGQDDFARCFDSDGGEALRLEQRWSTAPASGTKEDLIPEWDGDRHELTIGHEEIDLGTTPGESALTLEARRSAAADRYGNIYRIASDRLSLCVWSVGSRRESVFWPAPDTDAATAMRGEFQAARPSVSPAVMRMLALTVTEDHYLVVAFACEADRGFLSFDLAAGGPPVEMLWPTASFEPFELAPRCGGGVWVLDRPETQRRLWELDRRLAVVSRAQSEQTLTAVALDDFQPLAGPARERPRRTFPVGIDLLAIPINATDPIAIESLGCAQVLLLDRDLAGQKSRVLRLYRDGDVLKVDTSPWISKVVAHDFVLADAYERRAPTETRRSLYIATTATNQALAFAIDAAGVPFTMNARSDLFPLRRYGGRALLSVKGRAHYDSGSDDVRWTPIVQQPRFRWRDSALFVTSAFDSQEPQTTWDRVLLDACVPSGARIEVESRAADDAEFLESSADIRHVLGPWRSEPRPYLRTEGSELPWLRADSSRTTRRAAGVGTWEVLLQNARGRYLQLRITLAGSGGTATPRLRALRAWYPRFSYPKRFLPAVYREDATAASFMERWLANFEGTLTGIEERVVHAQTLLDPRTAPTTALGWLAEWFDVAFDPAWDEVRRRLFVRRAMDFFRWRGTTHGLRVALSLALDPCIDDKLFDDPRCNEVRPQSIRIVETFMTRLIGALAAGDPQALEQRPREVEVGERWHPSEGNSGLADRYARYLGKAEGATPVEQIAPFSLVPPPDAEQARRWREFAGRALGFEPKVGAEERARWRNFLKATQKSDAQEVGAPEESPTSIDRERLPADWPSSTERRDLWRRFCALDDGTRARARWVDFLARRYRRIDRLNRAHHTEWPGFDVVALPDVLPATTAGQIDWLQFEKQLLDMHGTAHHFSVLLPLVSPNELPERVEERLRLAQRIVDLEKPAHTTFDVRLYWALNRVGEARLGFDTLLGQGSRAAELIPYAQLGRAYVGASFVAGAERPADGDRVLVEC